ncbi:hypothetical protein AB85_5106 [Escherichia coli 2-156-04_S3_C1]|nr:hypothetical protein AB85_5106 [Escherichia coli 2-156-04_S3_C1]
MNTFILTHASSFTVVKRFFYPQSFISMIFLKNERLITVFSFLQVK